jgi:hypothetical protein
MAAVAAVAVATARWTLISVQEVEVEVVRRYQLKVPQRAFPIEQSEL